MPEQKRLDPTLFYLHGGQVHGKLPEGTASPINLKPVEELATAVEGVIAHGLAAELDQVGPRRSAIRTGEVTKAGNVLPPPPADEDDDDDEPSPYDGWKKKDLKREAESRELEVTRADGQDGEPLASDYLAALEADDASTEDEDEDTE